jgi:hypothetical protein
MDENRKAFSLRTLMLAVTCFATAAAIFFFAMRFDGEVTVDQLPTLRLLSQIPVLGSTIPGGDLLVLLLAPVFGAALGSGIGIIFRRFWIGALIGALVICVPLWILYSFAPGC